MFACSSFLPTHRHNEFFILLLLSRNWWKSSNTPSYGNCFTFNHVSNKDDERAGKRRSTLPGPFAGLKLVLDLEIEQYIKGSLTESSGALAVLQHPEDVVSINENGFSLMPNTQTSVSMTTEEVTRLRHPYPSGCLQSWSESIYARDHHHALNYTQQVLFFFRVHFGVFLSCFRLPFLQECLRLCFQEILVAKCGCLHPAFLRGFEEDLKVAICNLEVMMNGGNRDDYICVVETMNSIEDVACNACKPAC